MWRHEVPSLQNTKTFTFLNSECHSFQRFNENGKSVKAQYPNNLGKIYRTNNVCQGKCVRFGKLSRT